MNKSTCLCLIMALCQILFLILFSGGSFALQGDKESTHVIAEADDRLRHSQTLVMRYTETPTLIDGIERVPSLSIYNDGYARVSYPDYMKRAGNYFVRLDQVEMNQLYDLLINNNILEFDEIAIHKQMAVTGDSRAEVESLSNISDESKITLDIFPGQFRLISTNSVHQKDPIHITWSGLKQDTHAHPEISALQALSSLQQHFSAIMQHPDIQKVE